MADVLKQRTQQPDITGLPSAPRRRQPVLIAAGVLLAVLTAVIVAVVLSTMSATTLVWVSSTPTQRGTPVTEEQLEAVEAPASVAEQLVPATIESRESLLGRVWATDVPGGEFLTSAMVTDRLVVEDDSALVGLRLDPGAMPATGLRSGDRVMVIAAPTDVETAEPRVLVERATVESVVELSDQGAASPRLVTVAVPGGSASAVAAAGLAGDAALVVVP